MRLVDIDNIGIGKANRDLFDIPEYADGQNTAIEIIKSTPTAYDIDKVIEQLKVNSLKMSFKRKDHFWKFTWLKAISLKRAIEIVKKGGIR